MTRRSPRLARAAVVWLSRRGTCPSPPPPPPWAPPSSCRQPRAQQPRPRAQPPRARHRHLRSDATGEHASAPGQAAAEQASGANSGSAARVISVTLKPQTQAGPPAPRQGRQPRRCGSNGEAACVGSGAARARQRARPGRGTAARRLAGRVWACVSRAPEPMLVIRSSIFLLASVLANRPGQYGSTETPAALSTCCSFSAVTSWPSSCSSSDAYVQASSAVDMVLPKLHTRCLSVLGRAVGVPSCTGLPF